MYGVGGEHTLVEQELSHLKGYDGARPVRIGNGAYNQNQHDIWGTMLDSVYLHVRSRDQVPETLWPLLKRQVEEVVENCAGPTAASGRFAANPSTSRRRRSCAGSRSTRRQAGDVARREGLCGTVGRHRGRDPSRRPRPRCRRSWGAHPAVRQSGSRCVVAARSPAALPARRRRAHPGTVLAIADELTEDGLVLRYRVEETDDGLSGKEGTFTICSFWLVSALVEIGELERAKQLCERLLGFASPLKLYAEEIDPKTGRHLGNFPQAFTHLALINAVVHVIRAEEAGDTGTFQPAHGPS